MWRGWTKWLGVGLFLILALLFILVVHQVLLFGLALGLRSLTSADFVRPVARLFFSSPVYTELMLETLGGITPHGIAVSGPTGLLLHQRFSGLFLHPQFVAPGAVVSTVVDRNSTVLSLLVTRGVAEAAFLVLGSVLVRAGWRRRDSLGLSRFLPWRGYLLVVLGVYIEAQAIHALADLTLSPTRRGLHDTGIGFALSRILGLDPDSYRWVMDWWLPVAIPGMLILLSLLAAIGFYRLLHWIRRRCGPHNRPGTRGMPTITHAVVLALVVLLVANLPWSHAHFGLARVSAADRRLLHPQISENSLQVAPTETALPTLPAPTVPVVLQVESMTPTAAPTLESIAKPEPTYTPLQTPTGTLALPIVYPSITPVPNPTATPTPHARARTEIRRGPNALEFYVNDRRTIIAGLNYNVNYTGMPEPEKRALHRRDFKLLKEAGVNALIGWGVYDEVTLEVANEFGLGVFMPFELDPEGSFENGGYRDEVKTKFEEFVRRYKSFPAVWGWNPGGDELLHRMDTEQHRTTDKLQAAADLLVDLSTLAFSLDHDRISIVKEPRDWYIPYFDVALRRVRSGPMQADPSHYFVFGLNVYGHPDDVEDALLAAKRNAEDRLQVGMIVGEYAPFGLAREDRATHYATIWDEILQDTPNGGFAYVFGPDQPNPQAPNPYDPLRLLVNEFSLLDMNLAPVDDAFGALSARWRLLQAQTQP